MRVITYLAAVLAVALTGCAATVRSDRAQSVALPASAAARVVVSITSPQSSSSDWEPFLGEWRSAFRGAAAGTSLEVLASGAKPDGVGTLVTLRIDDYRYLNSSTRYAWGIMTGNAYIESRATFSDLSTGQVYGAKRYDTSSSAWEGVLSAMTDKQVAAIASEIVRDIRAGARPGAAPMVVSATSAPVNAAAAAATRIGPSSYVVEHMPEVRACNAQPTASLESAGAGLERYSVACTDGSRLSVRCEFGSCRRK